MKETRLSETRRHLSGGRPGFCLCFFFLLPPLDQSGSSRGLLLMSVEYNDVLFRNISTFNAKSELNVLKGKEEAASNIWHETFERR